MTKEDKTEAPAPVAQPELATTPVQPTSVAPVVENDNNIPLMAMIFGIVGLVTFMFFLAIPALVLGIIGVRKYSINRGFSITGIATGILGILGMIATIAFVVLVIMAGGMYGSDFDQYDNQYDQRYENNRQFDRSREGA